jgi:hypothetical protein
MNRHDRRAAEARSRQAHRAETKIKNERLLRGDPSEDQKDRLHMIACNGDNIARAHHGAMAEGMTDFVVILADVRDVRGREIAAATMSEAEIDAAIRDRASKGEFPVLTLATPRHLVVDMLKDSHFVTAERLGNDPPAPDGFAYVMAVGSGGLTVVGVPVLDAAQRAS